MTELVYEQSTGLIGTRKSPDAPITPLARGYSGRPPHDNQPASEGLRAMGPIPRGRYRVGRPFDHSRLGPVSLWLEPSPDNEMHGRSGFLIHGDNSRKNRTGSSGCIILDRHARITIAASGIRELVVV